MSEVMGDTGGLMVDLLVVFFIVMGVIDFLGVLSKCFLTVIGLLDFCMGLLLTLFKLFLGFYLCIGLILRLCYSSICL